MSACRIGIMWMTGAWTESTLGRDSQSFCSFGSQSQPSMNSPLT